MFVNLENPHHFTGAGGGDKAATLVSAVFVSLLALMPVGRKDDFRIVFFDDDVSLALSDGNAFLFAFPVFDDFRLDIKLTFDVFRSDLEAIELTDDVDDRFAHFFPFMLATTYYTQVFDTSGLVNRQRFALASDTFLGALPFRAVCRRGASS